jgi:glucose-6-phosphate dehydrogenase assembly protein OpcA
MIKELLGTTTHEVNSYLVSVREDQGEVATGRVLTLIIVTDEASMEAPIGAANRASREHPCRIIVIADAGGDEEATLDAEVRLGGDAGASEVIVLKTRGRATGGLDTLVYPLLLPDAPVVAWWPGQAPEVPSLDVIGQLAQRRITTSSAAEDQVGELASLRQAYHSGDTDLAWARLTNWRGLLASSLDGVDAASVRSATVVGTAERSSVRLLVSWLELALGRDVEVRPSTGGELGLESVSLELPGRVIEVSRTDDQKVHMSTGGEQTVQAVSMPRRRLWECLSEELRRLDPDEVYGEVLAHAFQDDLNHCARYALDKPTPRDVVSANADELAGRAADAVVSRLRRAVDERGRAHLVLTGGTVGTKVAAALAGSAAESEFAWDRVHVWWGDERYVGEDSSERNDIAVEDSFVQLAEGLRPAHVHRIPAVESGLELGEAASRYADELREAGLVPDDGPFFDVVLLGVGPDGHVASLFPEHPAQSAVDAPTVPVRESPKPPSDRVSLTFPALNAARSVLLLVSGAAKAGAVDRGHGPVSPWTVPASAVRGTEETVWYLDQEASGSR